ncbi:MAG: hypothetical protein K8823_390 [Cenarchaeum symbiont of Oopsacas minuta]|nr:hypothetical protein [Cenarchaeum symbiont of Oopsacas minuta]
MEDKKSKAEKTSENVAEEKKTDSIADKSVETVEVKPKEYTPEEIESIANKVETPADQTPLYDPKFILSKEFAGTSNYEHGIGTIISELQKTIDSEQDPIHLERAKEEMRKLDTLYENFYIGMNVFRTAKGGRDKLRV